MHKDEFSTRVKTGIAQAKAQGRFAGGFVDFTNKVFGKLIVRSQAKNGKCGRIRWNCDCECGGHATAFADNLSSGKTKSCGCEQGIRPSGRRPPFMYILYTYRASAKSKKLAFELTNEQFEKLVASNCDYCGAVPSQGMYPSHKRKAAAHDSFRWNGIDRIDSAKGYIEGNVVPCCKPCNELKSDKSREEFLTQIKAIHRWQNRQRAATV